jgi:hypothetical protein
MLLAGHFSRFYSRDFSLISGLETAGLHENAALVLDRCLRVASDLFLVSLRLH